ncbi:hypothetical protein A2313_03800 [Candidatus Roizmanbacteria bacterium RIFOXYB2_FULL_41_10]|nr:MAG: hypothetical protein A2262_04600 [Candidatus Roizmanbacteria bacterium RIFOXYA2_FULL_41_8]OGK69234.1 MAG: hypothetical protein A2313_03800 [Candidatus Roizmanbacteria bacterium RIFOXYB2_FULL_41_10]OGK72981.1 MAG: hypothetical protein A2459_00815 [Candidatus Roizmanbacteria bacterium RIFOXYC2_FULL_41_10]OGZ28247.1 MAG: hypothetical protein A2562_00220 [Candidatus Nealsonbacteria bacterium RIFOXYD1_FULL_39_11]
MQKTILFIDGENLRHYIEDVLEKTYDREKALILNVNLKQLFKTTLSKIKIDKIIYYSAKLKEHKETLKRSKDLIQKQRALKAKLQNQEFTFVMSGYVRPQKVVIDKKEKIIFKEKGVDVKMAVDLVSMACDKIIDTAIICSSDSDLQPAIKEIKHRGVKVIYLGFEFKPNKGLIYTASRAILIRNSEVIDCYINPSATKLVSL